MKKQLVWIITLGLFLLFLSTPALISANVSTGVKKGDWIEYQVITTGSPPGEHDAKWARMDVTSVQGPIINLNVTTQFNNSSFLYENVTLNLETGQIGDDFFIPANLTEGNVFFDAHAGNITIKSVEQKEYIGAERTVVSGITPQTTFFWDRQTGVLVEAYSKYPEYNFTMSTIADKTNMWQPQTYGPESTAFYLLAIGTTLTALAIGVVVTLMRRRKRSNL